MIRAEEWAAIRVAVVCYPSAVHGFDFPGFIALTTSAAALIASARSPLGTDKTHLATGAFLFE